MDHVGIDVHQKYSQVCEISEGEVVVRAQVPTTQASLLRHLGSRERLRIVASLGAGGMGEVYEARDTRLGRTVAIKVLPEELAADPARRARFEREARAVSQLAHPHVCTLYDVGEAEGVHFLVLEHCEGETLAERLERGALPVAETLRVGAEIAEALDAAHRQGVTHRDLKPANVVLTPSGAKLLDFGLARLAAGRTGAGDDLPTLSADADHALTAEGTVLGTYPYMAPEQVEGAEADARSDLFSLGAVLHEMATGRRAFEGRSAASIMAAVLKEEPEPLSRLQPVAPPALDHVVSRCLAKDPEERWQSAKDVAAELRWIAGAGSQAGVAAPVARRRKSRERVAWAVAALAGLALLGFGALFLLDRLGRGAGERPVRFSIQPEGDVVQVTSPVVAADGSFLVYNAWKPREGSLLYLRDFDRFSSTLLPGTENARAHFLSPDGRWVGFRAGGGIYKVARAGGDVLTVLADGAHGPGASWGPDGTIVYSTAWLGGLAEVGHEGGTPRILTEPDREAGEIGHWWPRVLPDGRAVLFTVFRAAAGVNDARVAVLDRDSGEYRVLVPGAQAVYVPSGHLVYYRAGAYHSVAFDPGSLRVVGDPVRILDDARELNPVGDEDSSLDVSAAGSLAYVPGSLFPEGSLVRVSPDGEVERLPVRSHPYGELRVSPTGDRVALTTLESGRFRIVVVDLARRIEETLDTAGNASEPAWHPDGRRLAWQSLQRGTLDAYWKDLESGAPEEPLVATDGDEWPVAFTRDGEGLLFVRSHPDGQYLLELLELDEGRESRPLGFYGEDFAVSPADRWLAYTAGPDGPLLVRPFPGPGAPRRLSRDPGESPAWGADGRTLFYERGDEVVALSYRDEGGRFVPTGERVLATLPGLEDLDITADGHLFALVHDEPETRPEIRVVLGWDREMARTLGQR